MQIVHKKCVVALGQWHSSYEVGANSRLVVQVSNNGSNLLQVTAARLFKQKVPSLKQSSRSRRRWYRPHSLLAHTYAKSNPIKVSYAHAPNVIVPIRVSTPNSIHAISDGGPQPSHIPMRRHLPQPRQPRFLVFRIRFEIGDHSGSFLDSPSGNCPPQRQWACSTWSGVAGKRRTNGLHRPICLRRCKFRFPRSAPRSPRSVPSSPRSAPRSPRSAMCNRRPRQLRSKCCPSS